MRPTDNHIDPKQFGENFVCMLVPGKVLWADCFGNLSVTESYRCVDKWDAHIPPLLISTSNGPSPYSFAAWMIDASSV
jgi:hypothetical protein